ncbi:hypothetical protein SprV_0602094800 [Sparganum proliferum]
MDSQVTDQAEVRENVRLDVLRQTGQSPYNDVPDDKGDARLGAAPPEEGVADTHLLQLALFGDTDLAEGNNVHLVARQFPGN